MRHIVKALPNPVETASVHIELIVLTGEVFFDIRFVRHNEIGPSVVIQIRKHAGHA